MLAPPPPIAGDDECTANAEKSRRTSPEEHEGQTGEVSVDVVPLVKRRSTPRTVSIGALTGRPSALRAPR